MLTELAKASGAIDDSTVRQDLMRLHTLQEIGRMNTLRLKALKAKGEDIPGFGNIGKLSMSDMMRLQRDLGLRIIGASGMLHAYGTDGREALNEATGQPFNGVVTEMALFAQAPPIYGGTDQVQRNIIGERVLGLPKDPGFDRATPFRQRPKHHPVLRRCRLDRQPDHGVQPAWFVVEDYRFLLHAASRNRFGRSTKLVAGQRLVRVACARYSSRLSRRLFSNACQAEGTGSRKGA